MDARLLLKPVRLVASRGRRPVARRRVGAHRCLGHGEGVVLVRLPHVLALRAFLLELAHAAHRARRALAHRGLGGAALGGDGALDPPRAPLARLRLQPRGGGVACNGLQRARLRLHALHLEEEHVRVARVRGYRLCLARQQVEDALEGAMLVRRQ
eukprot:scaffold114335_cov39-Phaeocystis_antarctica.AAC.1